MYVFCILCHSLFIIENLNICPSLHFVVFHFILFQYGLQIICLFLTPPLTLLCDFAQQELLDFLSACRYFVSFFVCISRLLMKGLDGTGLKTDL